ncbi:universal stress protein [Thermoleophilia bacterium SCSIO 60948]|nr:universal stress protein [Thermoleophilia bacterium SCSIO 60948]
MNRTLVVGFDGSDCADAALDHAIEIASELGDRIVITFGYEPSNYGEEHAAHREAVRKLGAEVTEKAMAKARERNVDAELALVAKRPVEALLETAAAHDARAIVIGGYGERPLKGAILGSTPHKLLHLSERPVLVVPAD